MTIEQSDLDAYIKAGQMWFKMEDGQEETVILKDVNWVPRPDGWKVKEGAPNKVIEYTLSYQDVDNAMKWTTESERIITPMSKFKMGDVIRIKRIKDGKKVIYDFTKVNK